MTYWGKMFVEDDKSTPDDYSDDTFVMYFIGPAPAPFITGDAVRNIKSHNEQSLEGFCSQ